MRCLEALSVCAKGGLFYIARSIRLKITRKKHKVSDSMSALKSYRLTGSSGRIRVTQGRQNHTPKLRVLASY